MKVVRSQTAQYASYASYCEIIIRVVYKHISQLTFMVHMSMIAAVPAS